jgi:hypothetical protein
MTKRSSLHPFTRALYERTAAGHVQVTEGARRGLFTHEGRWISGELREADPQLCGWVAADEGAAASAASDSHITTVGQKVHPLA